MNKTTHHRTTLSARFTLKPLLVVIPFTVLAACANNQGTTITDAQPQTNAVSSHIKTQGQNDTFAEIPKQPQSGPDLTINEPIEDTPFNDDGLAQQPVNENAPESQDHLVDNSEEGNTAMTVLVIENPEILSKLASTNITQVSTPQPDDYKETLNRPGKRVFHFGFNQSSLSEEDIELVEQHAEYLKANPELQVTIHGHTDAQGNANYNLKLSQQRASMMVSELIKQGINKDRIKTIGWGGGYPLVSTLNFAENRRIEIEYSAIHYAANQ